MRMLACYVLLGALTGACYQVMATQAPFSITISAEPSEVRAGSSVHLNVQMTNTSDHDLNCSKAPSNGLDRAYRYDVRDENGKSVPKIARKHPEIGETFSPWPCIIKPGETTTSGGLISVLYDMSHPGRYTIQVSRPVSADDSKSAVIYSNKIAVTVTP